MSKKLAFVLALASALLPLAANALGLGEIKLNSALNQTLSADIPIVGAAPDEIGSLHVKVASAKQFQQQGIPMPNMLSHLQFQVLQGPGGSASVHITSTKPVREPFLDFLVEATWDNGELIREYTVFLNPPNFETATQAAPAPAPAATQPAAAPVSVPATPAPAPVVSAPVVTAPEQPSQAAATPVVAPTIAAATSPLGGNYGPIRRGETLSEIALRMRPQGVTLNQMMIAIYRANPEVFMHNINLMMAGFVLRVPTMADIQSVRVAEANAEVRTQIEAWRAKRGMGTSRHGVSAAAAQPSLQLVAPSSAAQTAVNQVPGAGKGGTGTAGNAAKSMGGSAAASAATSSSAPIAVQSNSLAAVQSQAGKQAAGAKTTPLMPEKRPVTTPLPETEPAPPRSSASSGLLASLMNPYVIVLVIIVVLLLIVGTLIKRRRSAAPVPDKSARIKKQAVKSDNWEKEEKAGLKDVTATPAASTRGKPGAVADPSAGGAAAKDAAAFGMTATLKLDEADPVAEADFHMAYGLYDQAADVLKKALRQDPGRRDLKVKLLEVYFTAGDRSNFVETARGLRQEMGAVPDKDWENIAIMGRQVAADEALFSGDGTGTAGSSVDIPLDSGGTGTAVHTDMDPLAGAFDSIRPVTAPAATAASPTDEHVLDFSLPDIEPVPAKNRSAPQAALTGGPEFDLDSLTMEPAPAARKPAAKTGVSTVTAEFGTDSQVEFDKALKELSDFVNTNVPPQEEATKSGAAMHAALSLAADADVGSTGVGTGTGAGEETTGLNEVGTKLDLARAYIDMGDAEGAKHILDEVIEEGDAQQKQEARKLMQQLA